MSLYCGLTEFGIREVARNQLAAAAAFRHCGSRRLGVALLLGQIDDGHIRAFAGEQHGNGPPDAGIASSDQCAEAVELAGGLVAVCLEARRRAQR